ncbi:hypothetical protein BDB00DRAFT_814071 [Zychaea mexicana]|uniref:uncharacterized protein n=1 Tax=Zychaea mexicana TaxID=64656 RepID=UPI0022FDC49B|nr:uncharacterized protein BDB00DRAFT_814071 [Zychaea mexicana]KAI9495305.1 hypothetical protein BDB00DRAFT_814071 [Zychaea mexicana]
MASLSDQVSSLFNQLQKTSQSGQDERSLELCDQIIKLDANNKLALQCKVVTLIRLGQYTNALSLIARKFKDDDNLAIEKIYCYYRTNQLQPAMELLKELKQKQQQQPDQSLLFLEAQLLYAQDNYKEAIQAYQQLLDKTNKTDHIYDEIQVNLLAAKMGLAYCEKSTENTVIESSQYEVAYNAASLHLARGQLDEARKQLEAARKVCHDRLTEADMPQEEIDEELAVIATQLAYTYQRQGRVKDAMEIYQSVIDSGVSDASVKAIVNNNVVAIHQKKDLQDAAKKLKTATGKEVDARLKRYQKRVISMNESLLQLYTNKYDACRDSAQRLIQKYPENETLYLVLAAATYQQHKAEAAVDELKKYAEKNPKSLALRFATIQVQLLQSRPAAALATLQSYLSVIDDEKNKKEYYQPAVIALLVWLYEQTGQSDKAMETLDQASAYWKKDKAFVSQAPSTSIMKQTAAFKLQTGRYSEAVSDFEALVKADPTDAQAIAGLISAYIEVDPTKAEQYGNALPAIALDHLDIPALERSVPGVKRGYVKKYTSDSPRKTVKPKTKKKRKPLLPKNCNENSTPDPERWLPARERSTYRAKGKNKKAAGKGPQGSYVAGGGIGTTGSANIGGGGSAKASSEDNKDDDDTAQADAKPETAKPASPAKSSGQSNKKKKKKGKNKW